jgi:lipopolysaccharide/colanic/teichoic acid biosynthesis glycosyltransferase
MPFAYEIAKRAFDIAVSATALIATAPVTIPVAIAIRVTMGRPVLFRQLRPGRGGEPFEMFKFRTMRNLKPGESMLASDADRITWLGNVLRETSIDELPTFINVLRGDMSVVGPRPLLMRYLDRYTQRQARRHEVKPGITGLAAVNGRNALSWEERFEYDVQYVEERSLMLDLEIVARTIGAVLRREGIAAEGAATMHEFMGVQAAEAA